MAISTTEDYKQSFNTEGYLSTWYSKVDLIHHQLVFEGLHELFLSGECGGKILEIGSGPVIAWQISAAPYASEIVLAELVESNRDAVRHWLDKDSRAYNWTPFFRHVVQTLEGKCEVEAADREEQLRQAVKAVIPCDASKDPLVPPEYEGPYDVVVEIAVSDAVCKNEDDYMEFWARLATVLKPGGILASKTYLVENYSTPTHTYAVGEESFVALNVSETFLRSCLKKAGFINIKLKESQTFDSADHLTSRCVFLTAIKLQ